MRPHVTLRCYDRSVPSTPPLPTMCPLLARPEVGGTQQLHVQAAQHAASSAVHSNSRRHRPCGLRGIPDQGSGIRYSRSCSPYIHVWLRLILTVIVGLGVCVWGVCVLLSLMQMCAEHAAGDGRHWAARHATCSGACMQAEPVRLNRDLMEAEPSLKPAGILTHERAGLAPEAGPACTAAVCHPRVTRPSCVLALPLETPPSHPRVTSSACLTSVYMVQVLLPQHQSSRQRVIASLPGTGSDAT